MPVTADRASSASYAQFPPELDRDWLGRVCHLSETDLAVIRRRTDPVTQLGYATQLVTVRAIGTFQSDPAAVPEPVVAAVARQLGIDDPRRAGRLPGHAGAVAPYRRDPGPLRVPRLRRATRPVRLHRLVVPAGLGRRGGLVGVVPRRPPPAAGPADPATRPERADAADRHGARTSHPPGPQPAGAGGRRRSCGPSWRNSCWCPKGSAAPTWTCCAARRSRPRSPGWCAHWTGWTASGPSGPVSWTCRGYRPRGWWPWPATPTRPGPPSWPIWGPSGGSPRLTAYTHLLATSARDDVIDIFDVVFGDLQRAATHRGEKRRAGELRDYDRAVAAVHAHMRSLLDALDDQPALADVLEEFRTERAGIEENMGTVEALMRPPGRSVPRAAGGQLPPDPTVPAQADRGA